MKICILALAVLVIGCSGKSDEEACDDMAFAISFSEGSFCDGLGSCDSIPCVCGDGSTIDTSSCFNNSCLGIEACESACGSAGVGCGTSSANNQTPNNVTPNNQTPNNVTPNNQTPNNVTPNNQTPNNVTPNNSTGTVADGEECPRSCFPGIAPVIAVCAACAGGQCYWRDSTTSACSRECSSDAECSGLENGECSTIGMSGSFCTIGF